MLLDELLSRRMLILSGKGGVGKSTVGAALALAAQSRGKRVLLVEVAAPVGAARALGDRYGELGRSGSRSAGGETEFAPSLWTVNLDPSSVMAEYVRRVVKLELVARRILESPIYRRFFAAAPGLKELMVLGKVMTLEEARTRARRPVWDLIVLDAPATGHGLAFLKIPLVASSAVAVGPIGHNARRVLSLIRDEEKTALVVVAAPEEMAVVEGLELAELARSELGKEPSAFVLNACHERRFSEREEAEILRLTAEGSSGEIAPGLPLPAALRAGRRQVRRRKLTALYERRLKRTLGIPLVSLPFLFREPLGLDGLRLLAERLEAA